MFLINCPNLLKNPKPSYSSRHNVRSACLDFVFIFLGAFRPCSSKLQVQLTSCLTQPNNNGPYEKTFFFKLVPSRTSLMPDLPKRAVNMAWISRPIAFRGNGVVRCKVKCHYVNISLQIIHTLWELIT